MGEFPLMLGNKRSNLSIPSLDNARRKHFRAVVHLKELITELEWYFQTDPGAMVPEPEYSPDNPICSFQAKEPVPARFGLIVGDCLQNLRSTLDYLVWELVLAAGNTPSGDNMFPICTTPENFKKALEKKRLEGVGVDAKAEIESLQPYSDSDNKSDVLRVLDELTNCNKHRRVLLTTLGSAVIPGHVPSDTEQVAFGYNPAPEVGSNPIFRPVKSFGNTQVNAKLVAFMAFDEDIVKNANVTDWLGALAKYVGDEIIPKFIRFF